MPRKCIECGHIYFVIIQKETSGGMEPIYGFGGPRIECEAVCANCGTTWRLKI